jgi:hypothetical protein
MTIRRRTPSFTIMLTLSALLFGCSNRQEESLAHQTEVSPQVIMGWLNDLCDIAGYGIHSGIQTQPKLDEAADYILENLHRLGLRQAKLEPITANSPYPKDFEITVNVPGEGSRAIASFPLQWTAGTPPGGITGKLAYVGDGSASNFKLVDVNGNIVLMDEKNDAGLRADRPLKRCCRYRTKKGSYSSNSGRPAIGQPAIPKERPGNAARYFPDSCFFSR